MGTGHALEAATVPHRIAIASTDFIAADRVAIESMGVNPDWVGYLRYCDQVGLGNYNLAKIDVLGEKIENVRRTYRLHDTIQQQVDEWMQPMRDLPVNLGRADLTGLAFGNGTFVAASYLGTIYASPDGLSWTRRASAWSTRCAPVVSTRSATSSPELISFLQGSEYGGYRGGDMLPMLERLDAMPRMARRVSRDEHRFYPVVLDQFLQRRVRFLAATGLRQPGATIRNQIADRDDLHIRMILKTKGRAESAHAITDDAHAQRAVIGQMPQHDAHPGVGTVVQRGHAADAQVIV